SAISILQIAAATVSTLECAYKVCQRFGEGMHIERTVTTAAPLEAVFGYLADFTTTTEWDPGTVRTSRVAGDGGVGTRYHNTSRFLGRETELTYVVEQLVPGGVIHLRGENRTVVADDTMTFVRTPTGGTRVTY